MVLSEYEKTTVLLSCCKVKYDDFLVKPLLIVIIYIRPRLFLNEMVDVLYFI